MATPILGALSRLVQGRRKLSSSPSSSSSSSAAAPPAVPPKSKSGKPTTPPKDNASVRSSPSSSSSSMILNGVGGKDPVRYLSPERAPEPPAAESDGATSNIPSSQWGNQPHHLRLSSELTPAERGIFTAALNPQDVFGAFTDHRAQLAQIAGGILVLPNNRRDFKDKLVPSVRQWFSSAASAAGLSVDLDADLVDKALVKDLFCHLVWTTVAASPLADLKPALLSTTAGDDDHVVHPWAANATNAALGRVHAALPDLEIPMSNDLIAFLSETTAHLRRIWELSPDLGLVVPAAGTPVDSIDLELGGAFEELEMGASDGKVLRYLCTAEPPVRRVFGADRLGAYAIRLPGRGVVARF
ncbi:hypothetical protein BC828DRAFT_373781 [Blastocladiella britannica]|nr:hypothetical protein BC828DRAFT_373781 [Blastocladiella britannica]